MNHTYRLVWDRSLAMFVAVSELARSYGKSAGCKMRRTVDCTAKFSGLTTAARSAVLLLGVACSAPSLAHTTSVGYTIGANNSVEVWYGTYHFASFTEGSLDFSGPNSFHQVATFIDRVSAKPIGLNDGTTNFFSDGTTLIGTANRIINTWQGAQFTNLAAGAYTFTYLPIASPSSSWRPIDNVILSNGFTITAQQLSTPSVPVVPVSNPINTAAGSYSSTSLATTTTPNFTGGTLKLDSSTPVLAQNFTINQAGGTLDQNGNNTTLSGALSDASAGTPGSLTIANTGTGGKVTLTGANTFTGSTTINSGATLALSGAGSIATSGNTNVNGTLDVSASNSGATLNTLAGNGTVILGAQNLNIANAAGTFDGSISGSGGLAITAGNMTFSGLHTYTGATTINSGATLALTGAGGIAGSASTTVNGTLDVSASNTGTAVSSLAGSGTVALGNQNLTVTNASGNFAGNISGNGSVAIAGGNANLSGANSFTGAAVINNGATLSLTGAGSIASAVNAIVNGTLDVSGTNAGATINSIAGTGTVTLGTQNLTLTNAADNFAGSIGGNGVLVVAGGTQTLSGVNTHTGGTVVTNNATVSVATNENLGDAAGTLKLNQGTLNSSASFALARSVNLAGTGIVDTAASTTLAATGQVAGAGRLQKNGGGTLSLSGDNSSMTGGMTVNAGVVELSATNAAGTGDITINGGALHTTVDQKLVQALAVAGGTAIITDAKTTTLLTGAITSNGGNGCFIKSGAGTLNMAGAATLSQGTCVQAGMLRANGMLDSTFVQVDAGATLRGSGTIHAPITVAGTLAPGNSPGTLTTGSTVTMTNGSTYQEDINGTGISNGPGNYSRLLVTGSNSQFVIGASTLAVNLTKITGAVAYTPYVPQVGDSFRIISAEGGIVGRFANFAQPNGLAAGTRIGLFYDVDATHSLDLRILPVSYAVTAQAAGSNTNALAAAALVDRVVTADQGNGASASQTLLAAKVTTVEAGRIASVMRALSGEVHATVMAAAPAAGQAVQASVARQLTLPHEKALWADLNGSRSRTNGDDAASGFKADRLQLTVGVDVFRNDNSRLGVGLSAAHDNVSAAVGSGTVNQTMAFVYADHRVGNISLDGVAGFGRSLYSTHRPDAFKDGTLSSDARSHDKLLGVGLQGIGKVAGVDVKPFVRALWQTLRRGAYSEGNDSISALSLTTQDVHGTRVMTGLTALSSVSTAGKEPQAGLSTWQSTVVIGTDTGNLIRPVLTAQLVGDDMTIVTPGVGRAFLQANLSGVFQQSRQTRLFYGVVGEVRSGRNEVAVNGGVQVAF